MKRARGPPLSVLLIMIPAICVIMMTKLKPALVRFLPVTAETLLKCLSGARSPFMAIRPLCKVISRICSYGCVTLAHSLRISIWISLGMRRSGVLIVAISLSFSRRPIRATILQIPLITNRR